MEATYFYEGPLALSSMAAQAFLHFGISHAKKDEADFLFQVREGEGGMKGRLQGKKGEALWLADSPKAMARCLMDHLSEMTGEPLGPWGYFLGMRPVKALFRFFPHETWKEECAAFLKEEKVSSFLKRLIMAVAEEERELIISDSTAEGRRKAAFYVHVPFCPSHCLYCSFPAAIVKKGNALDCYTDALIHDIKSAGKALREKKLTADSFYMGGGTPSILTAQQMERVLTAFSEAVPFSDDGEMTVEAGRPDTMEEELLDVLAAFGVTRLSINPQTMDDAILRVISRSHRVSDIYDTFERVRRRPFHSVNMDFILGLPGETEKTVSENVDAICQLRPENVTIHTLAIKRGSPFFGHETVWNLPPEEALDQAVSAMHESLTALGYRPYYLYRQKYMSDDFANVGYTLSGHASRYNIQMMGERQHVAGCGAGSVSKAVMPGGFRLRKQYMPHEPKVYMERLPLLETQRNRLWDGL